jgi:hypothetical protein
MECTDRVLPSYSTFALQREQARDRRTLHRHPRLQALASDVFYVYGRRRAVEKYLEDPLAEEFLRGNVKQGDMLEVHAAGEQLAFKVTGAEASTYLGGPGPSSSCFTSFPNQS